MTEKHDQQKPYWNDYSGSKMFEEFQAGLSRWRRRADRKALRKIFKLAADSPALAEALAWAEKRGVNFFIDRSLKKWPDGGYLAGYYNFGTGALGIAACGLKHPEQLANTMTHELRHAWQDDKGIGINCHSSDYPEYFISQALSEADANAFGELAGKQYREARQRKSHAKRGLAPPKYLKYDEKQSLSLDFMRWFMPSTGKTTSYGTSCSAYFAQKKGLIEPSACSEGTMPDYSSSEFKPVGQPVKRTKISLNLQDVLPLGETFFGTANYLKRLPPDFLVKNVLRPSLAYTFWGAASGEQRNMTAKIRKVESREKLAQPKRRPSLP